MTAQLEERDKLHETTEETDMTVVKTVEMVMKETDAMDAMETDATDKMETDVLTIHLVTSNDLQDLPPSAWR